MSAYEDQDRHEAKGFAKLDFPDGDYIITTLDLVIGRNMELAEKWRRQRKQERHQQRAQKALEKYEQEPSQPSQADNAAPNGNPSSNSGSLEGRPERGVPSNFSEKGGAVHYQDMSDDDRMPRSRKRRRLLQSNSSNTSVTPASVHPSQIDLSGASVLLEREQDQRACARLPVHPQKAEDISKISQDHLLITYNQSESRWELHILGNKAIVNGHLYDRGIVLTLEHDDEIMIPGIYMHFKLPDNFRQSPTMTPGTFSEHQGSEIMSIADSDSEVSPSRNRPHGLDAVDNDEDDSEAESDAQDFPRKRSGIKLKFKKSAGSGKEKPKDKLKLPEEERKVPKMTKPSSAEVATLAPTQGEGDDSSVAAIPSFEPGSALADVPQDQLPQKRKGPGRPPKNGYVSKKDDKQVKKKMKEYETRGEEAPTYAQLVEEVRKEAKLKEQQSRNGGALSGEMDSVVPSIEKAAGAEPHAGTTAGPSGSPSRTSLPSFLDNDRAKKSSPKAKQRSRSRSFSPLKPEAECTEEELKKPTVTYVPLIDEAIRYTKRGYADLQQIYKAMQKLHPYYAYRVDGNGWQSSVRHNLKSERFIQVGKSGKGGYHAINYDFPLPNSEQKKGRKATPPPRPPMAMQNAQYVGAQMPQPPFGHPQHPYAQVPNNPYQKANGAQMQGHSHYQSPFAPVGMTGPVPHTHSNAAPSLSSDGQQMRNSTPGQTPVPNQSGRSSQPPQAHSYGGLVSDIMAWRGQYLQQFVRTPEYENREQVFKAVLERLSTIFNSKPEEYYLQRTTIPNQLRTDDEKAIFHALGPLFDKYKAAEMDAANNDYNDNQSHPHNPQQTRNTDSLGSSSQVQNAVGAAVAHANASTNANVTTTPIPTAAPAIQYPVPPVAPPISSPQVTHAVTSSASSQQTVPMSMNTSVNAAVGNPMPVASARSSDVLSPAPISAPSIPWDQLPCSTLPSHSPESLPAPSTPSSQLPAPIINLQNASSLESDPANTADPSLSNNPPTSSLNTSSTTTTGLKRPTSEEIVAEASAQQNKRIKTEVH